MQMSGPFEVEDVEHVDYLDVESLMIDLFNMIAAPLIISCMLGQLCYAHLTGDLYSTSRW